MTPDALTLFILLTSGRPGMIAPGIPLAENSIPDHLLLLLFEKNPVGDFHGRAAAAAAGVIEKG